MNPRNTELRPPEGDLPARVVWISPVNKGTIGYAMTDHNGELDESVKTCKGCQHFGVHDWHYYYCSMQYATNQQPNYSSPYPWRGAGALMHRPDAENCPLGERRGTGSSPPMPEDPSP